MEVRRWSTSNRSLRTQTEFVYPVSSTESQEQEVREKDAGKKRYWMLDAGRKRCWMLDAGCWKIEYLASSI
jgi:hypothetical protein